MGTNTIKIQGTPNYLMPGDVLIVRTKRSVRPK